MQNKKVLELDSFFGKLVACDEYVEIIPTYVTDSRKQGRKFYYQNISGITCKEPSVWWGPGYIQFIIPGEQAYVHHRKAYRKVFPDQNRRN